MTTHSRLTSFIFLAVIAASTSFAATAQKRSDGEPSTISSLNEHSKESFAETATFLLKGRKQTVRGRTIVEAADGGILFEGVDGVLWSIERGELQAREKLETPFK